MDKKRICNGICKKFRVKKPHGNSRYGSGQCRCQTCDIWMDHRGCCLKDRSSATKYSVGWYCRCCNFRVRRNPRKIDYKTKIRISNRKETRWKERDRIDLSYFNKRRATMIRDVVRCLPAHREELNTYEVKNMLYDNSLLFSDLEQELGGSRDMIIDLAYELEPTNKIAMIFEFEQVRSKLGRTPTRQEMDEYSVIGSSVYDEEFDSWEHMLDRLGYDPFYREIRKKEAIPSQKNNLDRTSPHPAKGSKNEKRADHEEVLEGDKYKEVNSLIFKAMNILRKFESIYLKDMKRILSVSEDEVNFLFRKYGRNMMPMITTSVPDNDMGSLVPRIARISGVRRKEIRYDGKTIDTLFEYSLPEDTPQDYDVHVYARTSQYNTWGNIRQKQNTYDLLWNRYSTSYVSRSLYVRFMREIKAIDVDIEEVMNKKFIALKINGASIVGIILKKSGMVLDFKLPVTDLDDTLNMLQDISQIGKWTSGKSRLNVSDEDMLQYGVRMTRRCYDHVTSSDNPPRSETRATKKFGTISFDNAAKTMKSNEVSRKDDTSVRDDMQLSALLRYEHTLERKEGQNANKSAVDSETNTQYIYNLTEQMVNGYVVNKQRLNKDLRRRLTGEFVRTRSVNEVMKNNPEIPKDIVMQHILTDLRLPTELKKMENEGFLHPDPNCSLTIALFAVNHYEWDGTKRDKSDVIRMAQSISKCLRDNMHLNQVFTGKKTTSPVKINTSRKDGDDHRPHEEANGTNMPSIAAIVWIATAMLHKENKHVIAFSPKEIRAKITEQKLCTSQTKTETISNYITHNCVANSRGYGSVQHRKLYRVQTNRLRLYRKGHDDYHSGRENGKEEPQVWELPDQYKDLLSWYYQEYCKIDET